MRNSLYFDTARLGQVTPRANTALCELLRYSWGHGSASDYLDLLLGGYENWQPSLKEEYPGLNVWPGLAGLKANLKQHTQAHGDSRVILANRSSQLMKFAALLFFGPCRNVLVTDCSWPSYEKLLNRSRGHAGREVSKLRIRELLLNNRLSKQEVVARFVTAFVESKCDGLFLPAVDNLGIAFPVKEIVQGISSSAELRFVVIDGAQAFCQTPTKLYQNYCDFFLAGCHKWLGAYLPMGLGFYGHRRSVGYIEKRLEQALSLGMIDDPLLSLTEEFLTKTPAAFGETVNLAPLFGCAGALQDVNPSSRKFRKNNLELCESGVRASVCRVLNRSESMRASVLLLQVRKHLLTKQSGKELSTWLARKGLIATCYDDGMIRLAMPSEPLEQDSLAVVDRAISSVCSRTKSVARGGV